MVEWHHEVATPSSFSILAELIFPSSVLKKGGRALRGDIGSCLACLNYTFYILHCVVNGVVYSVL